MEARLLSSFENTLQLPYDNGLSLQSLTLARSLIVNPSTSDATISSLLKTLTVSLQSLSSSSTLLHHYTLSLLSSIFLRRPHFSHQIFAVVLSTLSPLSPNTTTAAAAAALSLLLSIAEQDQTLSASLSELTETLFLSLSFRPSVSVRHWLLCNAERLHVRPSLLLTVLLGFTKDPYPYVRKAALDGLVGLRKCIIVEDRSVIKGCYFRAVELLFDMDDAVRCSAVCAVSEWGQLLVLSSEETSKQEWSDAVFVQLCQMVRDMSVDVRVKAFDVLGTVRMVSEDILLQTLSKKALESIKEKKYLGQFSAKTFGLPASSAARAFIHGLEDEFYEVRRSACHSLCMLSDNSTEFAGETLTLLMDMLNDDSITVRLQVLATMHHMAIFDHLNVQEAHMHMFLGTLVDYNYLIRSSARKILRVTKLQNFCMFKLSVDGLLENLKRYPQDEADVFSVLFNIGRSHGNFAVSIIKEGYHQIELSFEGESGMDGARTAALLVLAISAPLSHEQQICSIPPVIFSYAVTLLGRISHGLADAMDQNTLLAYLSHCSKSTVVCASEFFKAVASDKAFEIHSLRTCSQEQLATSHAEYFLPVHAVTDSFKLILAKVKDLWPLIQFGCISEVLRALRSWKEELATFATDSKSVGGLIFTLQYLRVVKLLGKVWVSFMSLEKLWSYGMGDLGLHLEKLDKCLEEIWYKFRGFSKDEELHVLELILLSCAMRLSNTEACSHRSTLKKMHSTIAHMEFLYQEGSIEPSGFVVELKNVLCGIGNSVDGDSFSPFLFRKSLEFFSLKQFVYCGELKYLHAELDVQGSDFENPLPFISGLPVGISFGIALYNILSENRLWLRMKMAEFTQFVYLDIKQLEGSDEIRKFPFIAPFYKTPKANSFTLRVSVGMECFSEDFCLSKGGCVGPKNELTYLCREKEVYFSMVIK